MAITFHIFSIHRVRYKSNPWDLLHFSQQSPGMSKQNVYLFSHRIMRTQHSFRYSTKTYRVSVQKLRHISSVIHYVTLWCQSENFWFYTVPRIRQRFTWENSFEPPPSRPPDSNSTNLRYNITTADEDKVFAATSSWERPNTMAEFHYVDFIRGLVVHESSRAFEWDWTSTRRSTVIIIIIIIIIIINHAFFRVTLSY